MRYLLAILFLLMPIVVIADEDDVECIYVKVSPKEKIVALTGFTGNSVERNVEILMETTLDPGTYEVDLTLIDDDIYHVEGTDYYLDMPLCFEIAIMDKAILKVSEYGGYTFAKVIWVD